MAARGRIDLRWAGPVLASALAAALMTNVFAQYLLVVWEALTQRPISAVPDLLAWARGNAAANPPLGIAMTGWPLAASATAGAAIVAKAASSRVSVGTGPVDPNTIHGSSRFATTGEMARYAHTAARTRDDKGRPADWPKPPCCEELLDDNYILSEHAMLSISANPNRAFERNKHVFVMAGSGAGKTWNFVQSNVLNLGASMVFTDPKGEILERNGNFLIAHGYKLKVVNVKDEESFESSNRYNPFHYCRNATAVNEIVDLIIENTSGDGPQGGNAEFFVKAERQLYNALGGYLYFMYRDKAEQYCTIPQMIDLLALTKQDPDAAKSQLDLIFNCTAAEGAEVGFVGYREHLIQKHGSEEAARMSPEWYPITEYEGFCTTKGSPETIASIIASCYVRLAPFAISSVRNMFSDDDLELERMADEKTALFIVTSAQKGTYDFIAAMLLYQLFDVLTSVADALPGKHLPSPICCYLDEVANIGKIPGLEKQVAVLRSYWVNLIVIVQSETDLERAYGREKAKSIRNNCDTTLYLGRGDIETCEKISKEIGDTTRSYVSWSVSESASGRSVSRSTQYVKVPLRTPDQIANETPANGCYVHFKEERWFEDAKANPREHRRFAEWSAMPAFDIRQWAQERRLASAAGTEALMEPDGTVTVRDDRSAPASAGDAAYLGAT